jgi:hypothetical protein
MKVYIDSPGSPFDVVVLVRTPEMKLLLNEPQTSPAKDRSEWRSSFQFAFASMFGKARSKVRVRFEDECEVCGSVKESNGNGTTRFFCNNITCVNGVPPISEMARLMAENRPTNGGKELAGDYFNRLVQLWKDEHNNKPKVTKEEKVVKRPEFGKKAKK